MIQLTEAAASALHSAIATVPTSIAGLRLGVQSRDFNTRWDSQSR
jgi:Fe-S cluster assembly iron-binding protein IscA